MIAEFEERYKSEPTFYHSKYKKSSAKVKRSVMEHLRNIFHRTRMDLIRAGHVGESSVPVKMRKGIFLTGF